MESPVSPTRPLVFLLFAAAVFVAGAFVPAGGDSCLAQTGDDLVFVHHSCGRNWLNNYLDAALLAKNYIDERNDVTYGTDIQPDPGRPDSLGSTPGDRTDMNHWILWFNDYLAGLRSHGCATGFNRIIMFKSCFPNSNITSDGAEPGDPFSSEKTLANYKAVYRHPGGPGNTYSHGGYVYEPLEDVFAANPDVLFVPVTAPPRHYAPSDATNDQEAHRARLFNNWLKYDWLAAYNRTHPGLENVAVFDWFDVLAYPDDHPVHPNRLRAEYGGESGDSHPNAQANVDSTVIFADSPECFIDGAFYGFTGSDAVVHVMAGGGYGPLETTPSDPVSIAVGLDPGQHAGRNADWWVFADSPFGYYSYVYPAGWIPRFKRSLVHPLFTMADRSVFDGTLPAGDYVFYFAVDDNADGIFDATWGGAVEVHVR